MPSFIVFAHQESIFSRAFAIFTFPHIFSLPPLTRGILRKQGYVSSDRLLFSPTSANFIKWDARQGGSERCDYPHPSLPLFIEASITHIQKQKPFLFSPQREQPLVEALDHRILHTRIDLARHVAFTQPKHALDDAELGGGGVGAQHGAPVVDDHAGADDGRAPVDAAGHERDLQQRGQLVLVLDRRLGVDDAALVGEGHVAADEDVVGDGLAEDLDAQHVRHQLLRLALQVRVHQRDVVVDADDVAQRRQPLFHPPHPHLVRQAVAQVLQLLVRRARRHEQPAPVARREPPDDACARDGAVHDGDYGREFGFEDAVEGFAGAERGEGVRVGEGGEDADSEKM